MVNIIGYEPSIQKHPAYEDVEVDFEVGDAVEVLNYTGSSTVRDDDGDIIGQIKTLGSVCDDKDGIHRILGDRKEDPRGNFDGFERIYFDPTDPDDIPEKINLTASNHIVKKIDGYRVKVAWSDRDDNARWIPRDRIVGTDLRRKAEIEYRREKHRRWRQRIQERKQTDMDTLMENVVIPHARKIVNEVWPGGSVDVDAIDWFWNPYLTNAAGKAYYGSAVPESMASGRYAIGLAPDYYYQHGIDSLLEVVRHELIHQWEYQHPDGKGGHGPKFKQWCDDMDCERHCKTWSKESSFSVSD